MVSAWNEERDNLNYNPLLEHKMIKEELNEYREAIIAGDDVGEADALADIAWVAIGSLFKKVNGDLDAIHSIFSAVSTANNAKGKDKTNGKITKPKNFKGPEKEIRRILNDC